MLRNRVPLFSGYAQRSVRPPLIPHRSSPALPKPTPSSSSPSLLHVDITTVSAKSLISVVRSLQASTYPIKDSVWSQLQSRAEILADEIRVSDLVTLTKELSKRRLVTVQYLNKIWDQVRSNLFDLSPVEFGYLLAAYTKYGNLTRSQEEDLVSKILSDLEDTRTMVEIALWTSGMAKMGGNKFETNLLMRLNSHIVNLFNKISIPPHGYRDLSVVCENLSRLTNYEQGENQEKNLLGDAVKTCLTLAVKDLDKCNFQELSRFYPVDPMRIKKEIEIKIRHSDAKALSVGIFAFGRLHESGAVNGSEVLELLRKGIFESEAKFLEEDLDDILLILSSFSRWRFPIPVDSVLKVFEALSEAADVQRTGLLIKIIGNLDLKGESFTALKQHLERAQGVISASTSSISCQESTRITECLLKFDVLNPQFIASVSEQLLRFHAERSINSHTRSVFTEALLKCGVSSEDDRILFLQEADVLVDR
jgi:hypothetical protein